MPKPNCKHLMARAGIQDSREMAEQYFHSVLGNPNDPDVIGAFLDSGPEMRLFLERHSEVSFDHPSRRSQHDMALNADRDARVLDRSGNAIAGLYAAGLDMNCIMRGLYPGGGASIGPAMTFAYRSAQHMAKARPRRKPAPEPQLQTTT